MSKTREALEAAKAFAWSLQSVTDDGVVADQCLDLLTTLEAALAEPEQEPVMIYRGRHTIDCGEFGSHDMEMLKLIPAGTKLYTSPQPREWQELSEQEALLVFETRTYSNGVKGYTILTDEGKERALLQYREISAALRAKNGG